MNFSILQLKPDKATQASAYTSAGFNSLYESLWTPNDLFKSQFPNITNLSKEILEKSKIDWFKGPENIVHAPNRNHSIKAAEAVQKALLDANQVGTRDAVVKALQTMGREFAEEGALIFK